MFTLVCIFGFTLRHPVKVHLLTSYAGDMFCTPDKNAPNPLTGSFFLLEKIDTLEPAPKYDYDESGVVLKGKLTALIVSLFDADKCS